MEDATSWKNHSFTLMIFGGIIVLCSIFFALGMLVGRGQGRQLAELASTQKAANKSATSTVPDNLTLDFYKEARAAKPDLSLQPQSEPSESARLESSTAREIPKETKPETKADPKTEAKPEPKAAPSPLVPVAPPGEAWLQISASKTKAQANSELKKVQSKGFKAARIFTVKTDNGEVHKVLVGPYKQSEINLAKSDLQAKGYKDVFVPVSK